MASKKLHTTVTHPVDIAEIRKRCAMAIRNTQTGVYLGACLDELQMMRDREPTLRAGRAVASNLLEIAMEQRDPAKWAALMLTKGTSPLTTTGEAMDLIEGTLRHALELMLQAERDECDRRIANLGNAFVDAMDDQ